MAMVSVEKSLYTATSIVYFYTVKVTPLAQLDCFEKTNEPPKNRRLLKSILIDFLLVKESGSNTSINAIGQLRMLDAPL